jgi:hypothetical protein
MERHGDAAVDTAPRLGHAHAGREPRRHQLARQRGWPGQS